MEQYYRIIERTNSSRLDREEVEFIVKAQMMRMIRNTPLEQLTKLVNYYVVKDANFITPRHLAERQVSINAMYNIPEDKRKSWIHMEGYGAIVIHLDTKFLGINTTETVVDKILSKLTQEEKELLSEHYNKQHQADQL